MYLLGKPKPKPKRSKMGIRQPSVLRSAKHLKWIRSRHCIDPLCERRDIEAAHVRHGLPMGEMGGVGIKPSDLWVVPMCREHHHDAHAQGHETFEREHLPPGVSMVDLVLKVYGPASPDPVIREKAKGL